MIPQLSASEVARWRADASREAPLVVDVREPWEVELCRIDGSVSIPLGELKARFKELPKHREVVAYCRGPYCVFSVEAVALLRKKGFKAHRMQEGVLDWRGRGWRLDTEPDRARGNDAARRAR